MELWKKKKKKEHVVAVSVYGVYSRVYVLNCQEMGSKFYLVLWLLCCEFYVINERLIILVKW